MLALKPFTEDHGWSMLFSWVTCASRIGKGVIAKGFNQKGDSWLANKNGRSRDIKQRLIHFNSSGIVKDNE